MKPTVSPAQRHTTERDQWTDWLASIGYGIDFNSQADPPCSIRDLADAYVRITGEDTAEVWEWCIRQNTGAFGEANA